MVWLSAVICISGIQCAAILASAASQTPLICRDISDSSDLALSLSQAVLMLKTHQWHCYCNKSSFRDIAGANSTVSQSPLTRRYLSSGFDNTKNQGVELIREEFNTNKMSFAHVSLIRLGWNDLEQKQIWGVTWRNHGRCVASVTPATRVALHLKEHTLRNFPLLV